MEPGRGQEAKHIPGRSRRELIENEVKQFSLDFRLGSKAISEQPRIKPRSGGVVLIRPASFGKN
jgi:hypothetical protein